MLSKEVGRGCTHAPSGPCTSGTAPPRHRRQSSGPRAFCRTRAGVRRTKSRVCAHLVPRVVAGLAGQRM
eukprot:1285502-Rhodomonas_salina.4